MEEEERQYHQAFGVHTYGISEACKEIVSLVKDNDDYTYMLECSSEDTENFTNQAWRLLG